MNGPSPPTLPTSPSSAQCRYFTKRHTLAQRRQSAPQACEGRYTNSVSPFARAPTPLPPPPVCPRMTHFPHAMPTLRAGEGGAARPPVPYQCCRCSHRPTALCPHRTTTCRKRARIGPPAAPPTSWASTSVMYAPFPCACVGRQARARVPCPCSSPEHSPAVLMLFWTPPHPQGVLARVFRATCIEDGPYKGKEVAIKIIKLETLTTSLDLIYVRALVAHSAVCVARIAPAWPRLAPCAWQSIATLQWRGCRARAGLIGRRAVRRP